MMEAAIWDKPVFYGPSIGDFRDAAELLESVEAGFRVDDVRALEEKIRAFRNNPAEYQGACRRAGDMARMQQGAAERQAAIVMQCLESLEREQALSGKYCPIPMAFPGWNAIWKTRK